MKGGRRRIASIGLAMGASLLLLLLVAALVWEATHKPDRSIPKVTVGIRDEVYYSHAASREDALALGRALQAIGYFRDLGAAALLSRNAGGTVVSFVLRDNLWNNPAAAASFEEIGRRIAAAAAGFPIELRLVDTLWTVRKTMQVGKIRAGARDEIYYFGSATQGDAEALGRALRAAGYLQDLGVTVSVSKDEGTSIGFVVGEGLWGQPDTVARFARLARTVAGSVGGLPLQLRILSPEMETKQETEVR